MVALEQYADQYNNIRFERRNGILQMTFHTNGGPLQWGSGPHEEFPRAFADVGSDRENRVIIVTGTGDAFSGPQGTAAGAPKRTPQEWDKTYWEGKKLLSNLLDIEVPMIAAVNGPALRHSEIPLLCDIVLAADTAAFQDSGHFMSNLVPGDGVHVVYPMLLGANRGRYFLLTGQSIGAEEALRLGLVGEVLSPEACCPGRGNWRSRSPRSQTWCCVTPGSLQHNTSSDSCRTCWDTGWPSRVWVPPIPC